MKRFGIATPSARKKAGAGKKAGKSPAVSISPASPLPSDISHSPKAGPFSVADLQSPRVSAEEITAGRTKAVKVAAEPASVRWETDASGEDSQPRAPRPAVLQPAIILTDQTAKTVLFPEGGVQREEAHPMEGRTRHSLKKYSTELPDNAPIPMSYDEFLSSIDGSKTDRLLGTGKLGKGKQENVEQLRRQALEREAKRMKRHRAATVLQALIRGFLARRRFSGLQQELSRMRRRHQLAQLRARIQASWAPYRIYKALKTWAVRQKTRREGLFLLFQHHCAVSIQKIYRGFHVRRLYGNVLGRRRRGRGRLEAVVVGWKTRRILKFRKVKNVMFELKEMMALTKEGGNAHALTASDLFDMINQQIPVLKAKLWDEFQRLYRSGKWVERPKPISKAPEPTQRQEVHPVEPVYHEPPPPIRRVNRDDMPVSALKVDYSQIEDEIDSSSQQRPAPHEFLKRSGKVTPLRRGKTQDTKRPKREEKSEDEETREKSPHSDRVEENVDSGDIEEQREEDDRPPQPFLKRRSQAVQAQKLSWKVRSRIDCWGQKKAVIRQKKLPAPLTGTSPKHRKSPLRLPPGFGMAPESPSSPRVKPFSLAAFDLSPVRKSKLQDTLPVEQLEAAFGDMERRHVFVREFFRRTEHTALPQFQPDSYFVTHYTEEIYPVRARQETLETLERHYTSLCSEEGR